MSNSHPENGPFHHPCSNLNFELSLLIMCEHCSQPAILCVISTLHCALYYYGLDHEQTFKLYEHRREGPKKIYN